MVESICGVIPETDGIKPREVLCKDNFIMDYRVECYVAAVIGCPL